MDGPACDTLSSYQKNLCLDIDEEASGIDETEELEVKNKWDPDTDN